MGEQRTAAHSEQDEHAHRETQLSEAVDDGITVLDKEDRGQEDEGREGNARQDVVHLVGGIGPSLAHGDTHNDGQEHEHDVLHQELAHRQVDLHGAAGRGSDTFHDERHSHQRDDAAASRERYRQGHVALGKHREHVRRTAARAAGNEHKTNQENGLQPEGLSQQPCQQGQNDDLPDEAGQYRPRARLEQFKIFDLQVQAQLKHEERQDGQYNPNRVHLVCHD